MDLSETQWKIVEKLAKKSLTTTELAKGLGISVPSTHAQLGSMLSRGVVKKTLKKGNTRPYNLYSLVPFANFEVADSTGAIRRTIPLDEHKLVTLRIWALPQPEFHAPVEEYWHNIQRWMPYIDAVALYGSIARGDAREGSDVDLLVFSERPEKLERIKGMFLWSSKKCPAGSAQIFEAKDFYRAGRQGSDFVKRVKKELYPLFDPKKLFSQGK